MRHDGDDNKKIKNNRSTCKTLSRAGHLRFLKRDLVFIRVFVWGRRPDVSSGRFPFHVWYFDFNIWEIFFNYFIIEICFYLSISWIYWLEDNRILQLNSSKVPHSFFSLLIEWNIWLIFRFISTKLKWPFRFHSCSTKLKGNTLHVLDGTSVGEMKRINEFLSPKAKRKPSKVKEIALKLFYYRTFFDTWRN